MNEWDGNSKLFNNSVMGQDHTKIIIERLNFFHNVRSSNVFDIDTKLGLLNILEILA